MIRMMAICEQARKMHEIANINCSFSEYLFFPRENQDHNDRVDMC